MKEAEAKNRGSFTYAFFTDRSEEERNRGVTIQATLVKMETEKFNINILDCPGHSDYIKNATSGCKQSDISVVVCPAKFEASCSATGTLKTHLTLAAILGSKNFIVCINKIDDLQESQDVVKTRYDAACEAVYSILKKLGVQRDSVIFLPISALKGIGLFKDSDTYPFYEGAKMVEKKTKKATVIKTLEDALSMKKSKAGSSEPTGIKAGYTPVISCGTSNVACKFAKLLTCTTKDKEFIENPNIIPSNARFDAIVYPTKDTIFECASDFPGLGKFICRDSGILVVVGQVTGKVTSEQAASEFDLNMALVKGDKEALKKDRSKRAR